MLLESFRVILSQKIEKFIFRSMIKGYNRYNISLIQRENLC